MGVLKSIAYYGTFCNSSYRMVDTDREENPGQMIYREGRNSGRKVG